MTLSSMVPGAPEGLARIIVGRLARETARAGAPAVLAAVAQLKYAAKEIMQFGEHACR